MNAQKAIAAEKINSVLFAISGTVNGMSNLSQTLCAIHSALSQIIDVSNFFIALYQRESDSLEFIFETDDKVKYSCLPNIRNISKGPSLSYQVIQTGRPLLIYEDEMIQMAREKNQDLVGPSSKVWLGVPLKRGHRAFGVMAVQSYEDSQKFTRADIDILQLAADQIAMVIEKKQAEEKLKKRERQYRRLIENIDDVIFSVDPEGGFSYISPSVKKLIGYSNLEILDSGKKGVSPWKRISISPDHQDGPCFEKLIYKKDRERVSEAIFSAISLKTGYDIEYRIRKRNRKIIWIRERGRILSGSSEAGIQIEGVLQDIHERKHAEDINTALFDITNSVSTTLNLDHLFKAIHQILSGILDVTNFFIALYQEAEDTLEFPYAVDKKDDYSKIPIQKNISSTSSLCSRVIQASSPLLLRGKAMNEYRRATRHLDKAGTPSKCWLGVPLKVKGKITGVIAIQSYTDDYKYTHKDVDILMSVSGQIALAIERKQAEEDLKAATITANAANKAKSNFLANMSHEIRTPMNAVMGMISMILDTPLNTEQHEYVRIAYDSSVELLRIINDILDFSKIEAGRMDIRKEDFDLRLTLEGIRDTMSPGIKEKGLLFDICTDQNLPASLKGDPGRLRQVIINLLGNALKFTEKGRISIQVLIESERDTDVVLKFIVQDTGIGIMDKDKADLFNSFTQADGSSTRKYGGTGLGLAIVKKLVGLMGGKIDFISEKDKGSTFFFSLSFEKSDNDRRLKTLQQREIKNKIVLMINQDPVSALQITKYLESFQCRPILCETVGQITAHVKAGEIDYLLVVDDMPGLHAMECSAQVMKHQKAGSIPMIMIAARACRGDAEKAVEAGFSAFLSMPITREQLYGCLCYAHEYKFNGMKKNEEKTILTRHKLGEIEKNSIRVLLVEDNPVNQKLALLMLKKMNFAADVAENGKIAVRKLEEHSYDLVLMDIQMPEMDGYEAARIIRDPQSKVLKHDIPIIALTAHALPQDRQACLDAGMNDHITKPVKPEILFEAVKRNLRIKAA